MDSLELEFIYCCNARFHMYELECALWRIYNDNQNESIMDMITTAKGLQYAYADRANTIRSELIAMGWN